MDATQTPEEWRPIPGYEGHYEASSLGRIRSIKQPRPYVLKLQWCQDRYSITLSVDGKVHTHSVHTLVTAAFHGPRPQGMWACHNNSDPLDNRPENLRWDTPGSNHRDMIDLDRHHYGKRTRCKRGHEYSEENTYWMQAKGGKYVNTCTYRRCKKCDVINGHIGREVRKKKRQRQ